MAGVRAGFWLAVGLFTVFPTRHAPADRAAAGWAMGLAPLLGLGLGLIAGAIDLAALRLGLDPYLAAALAVGSLAWFTRGLHLDGLADLADGLGSGKPAADALVVMKKPDIGPFGVATIVLVLLVQVLATAQAGPWALAVAAMTGRLAVTWACREGVPSARPGGLGDLVAGSVGWPVALGASVLTLGVSVALTWNVFPVVAGLVAAWVLLRRAVRRLGGVTGDVFGALVESATTAALLTGTVVLT